MLTTRTAKPCSACGSVFVRERFDGEHISIVCLLCGRPAERNKPDTRPEVTSTAPEPPSPAELAALRRALRQQRAAAK